VCGRAPYRLAVNPRWQRVRAMASDVLESRAMKTTILLSLSALLLAACGSDVEPRNETKTESAPTSVSACEAAGMKLCARACTCAADGKCRAGTTTDAGVGSLDFKDEKSCRNMYVVLGCLQGGEPGFDYARCEDAVEMSACVDTAGGRGVLMPDECKVPRK